MYLLPCGVLPIRGSWATHRGVIVVIGPQIHRALILKYTNPGDTLLDVMSGSGTTCIEALLLGRNCVAVDINYNAVMPTHHRLYYLVKALRKRRQKKLIDYTGVEERNNAEG